MGTRANFRFLLRLALLFKHWSWWLLILFDSGRLTSFCLPATFPNDPLGVFYQHPLHLTLWLCDILSSTAALLLYWTLILRKLILYPPFSDWYPISGDMWAGGWKWKYTSNTTITKMLFGWERSTLYVDDTHARQDRSKKEVLVMITARTISPD